MELEVQKFLRRNPGNGLELLDTEQKLKVVEKGDLVLLGYKQIEASGANPIHNECRGLILEKGTWNIVSFPFRRFFNLGEGYATKNMNWDKATALEKLDGTLISLWNYKGEWRVSTRGTIDAEGQVGDFDMTFKELFMDAIKVPFDEFTKGLDLSLNLCFELTSMKNRIVTVYRETGLHLLMGRNKKTWSELKYEELQLIADSLSVRMPKTYNFGNMGDIVKMSSELPQLDEGYVVVDYSGVEDDGVSLPRIKVKNPAYVAIAHLKDSSCSSRRRLLELVIKNEGDEFLAHFPEFTDEYNKLKVKYNEFANKVKKEWGELQPQAAAVQAGDCERKEFAIKASKTSMPGALFTLLDKRVDSLDDYFQEIPSKKWMDILKIKDKENTNLGEA